MRNNRGDVREQKKRYRKRHRQRVKAAKIWWVLTHPEEVEKFRAEMLHRKVLRYRLKNHVRRARMRSDGSKKRVAVEVVAFLQSAQKGRCAVCRGTLARFHVDHVLPLALGGTNEKNNLQLLCAPCNQSKFDKHPVDFMQERGMLL